MREAARRARRGAKERIHRWVPAGAPALLVLPLRLLVCGRAGGFGPWSYAHITLLSVLNGGVEMTTCQSPSKPVKPTLVTPSTTEPYTRRRALHIVHQVSSSRCTTLSSSLASMLVSTIRAVT